MEMPTSRRKTPTHDVTLDHVDHGSNRHLISGYHMYTFDTSGLKSELDSYSYIPDNNDILSVSFTNPVW
jgi:methionine salvage enolase-phosphatase E1